MKTPTIFLLALFYTMPGFAQQAAIHGPVPAKFSFRDDPPGIITAAIVNGQYSMQLINFNLFGTGYQVQSLGTITGIPVSSDGPQGGVSTTAPELAGPSQVDQYDFDPGDIPPPSAQPSSPAGEGVSSSSSGAYLASIIPTPGVQNANGGTSAVRNASDSSLTATKGSGEGLNQLPPPPALGIMSRFGASHADANILRTDAAAGAYTPDGKSVLITNYASSMVSVLNLSSQAVTGTVALPPGSVPDGISITRDGKTAYVTNFLPQGASVFVIDIASLSITATLPADPYPAQVRITPDQTQIWVSSIYGNSVTIFDTLTNKQVGRQVVPFAWGVAFDRIGTRAYVASSAFGGNVVVIDMKTYRILATIPVGPYPRDVIVTPSGRHVFVTHPDVDYVGQIDTLTNTMFQTISVGTQAGGFLMVP